MRPLQVIPWLAAGAPPPVLAACSLLDGRGGRGAPASRSDAVGAEVLARVVTVDESPALPRRTDDLSPPEQTPPRGITQAVTGGLEAASALARGVVAKVAAESEGVPVGAEEGAGPVLVATAKETPIHARPSFRAPKIGHLRAGAVVARSQEPKGNEGCSAGFYEISPEGFVCVGSGASIDPNHELVRVAARRADRTGALPYVYGRAEGGAPQYSRIPTGEEQSRVEPDLAGRKAPPRSPSFDDDPLHDVPWFLRDGAPTLTASGNRRSPLVLELSRAIPRSGFAFVTLFESGGRRFGLTTDMAITPLDRWKRIEPSRFHGMPLDDATTLPVVFARGPSVALYEGDPTTTGLRFVRKLEYREGMAVTDRRVTTGGRTYVETRDGKWAADGALLRVDPRRSLPHWASSGKSWLDVSLGKQVLVAYEGDKPVFVTLVSSGEGGAGDAQTTHATIQGEFRVHTKHVTTTMDSDDPDDQFDLRDVPYVQYFKDGYAFHAAYWHDGFGVPRSHGCINLSPLDARFLFGFTEPRVPSTWHGALSSRGTLVQIHE